MLIDHLKNAKEYLGANRHLDTALMWLEQNTASFAGMENGEYEIDGRDVYAIVNSYDTKPKADCGWEAHKEYCDIHYSVEGRERIGYANIANMELSQEHNQERDYALYRGEGDFVLVDEGMFCYLRPQDVHAPGCMVDEQAEFLKKVIIKLKA